MIVSFEVVSRFLVVVLAIAGFSYCYLTIHAKRWFSWFWLIGMIAYGIVIAYTVGAFVIYITDLVYSAKGMAAL